MAEYFDLDKAYKLSDSYPSREPSPWLQELPSPPRTTRATQLSSVVSTEYKPQLSGYNYQEPRRAVNDGLRLQRRHDFAGVKQQWDLAESVVTFVAAAWAADKVLSKMPRTTAVQRVSRDERIASASVGALAAAAIEYTADRIILPNDQKMQGTAIADWIVGTGIALSGLQFKVKLGSMLAAHAVGRCIDHFQQPKQDF
jgi:hypothetical protein